LLIAGEQLAVAVGERLAGGDVRAATLAGGGDRLVSHDAASFALVDGFEGLPSKD
jgi:hypothetical protein